MEPSTTTKPWFEEKKQISQVLDNMRRDTPRAITRGNSGIAPMKAISDILENTRNDYSSLRSVSATTPHYWAEAFVQIRWYSQRMLEIANLWDEQKLIEVLHTKNKLYGPGPISRWGEIGVIIRIDSKWQRYLNLLKLDGRTISETEESRFDTLMDIHNYAILGYYFHTEVNG